MTLLFDNGICFEKPKYALCFLLNSHHFEACITVASRSLKIEPFEFTSIFHKKLYIIPFCLKIVGHEDTDNNLESRRSHKMIPHTSGCIRIEFEGKNRDLQTGTDMWREQMQGYRKSAHQCRAFAIGVQRPTSFTVLCLRTRVGRRRRVEWMDVNPCWPCHSSGS